MRGRKPKPTEQRRLQGNPGHRPLNTREPRYATLDESFDVPPAELADHATAKAIWLELAGTLREARQVARVDRHALVALCLELGIYHEAMARVRVTGMVVTTPAGYPMPNPYRAIATKALHNANKLMPELGLTPSSRSRIMQVNAPRDDDPFAEFDVPPPDLPTFVQ